jgi:hypothetical protein
MWHRSAHSRKCVHALALPRGRTEFSSARQLRCTGPCYEPLIADSAM